MFEGGLVFKIVTWGFVIFIVWFIWAVLAGAQVSAEQAEKCRAAGGVPSSERGVYKACMKPDNFIKID